MIQNFNYITFLLSLSLSLFVSRFLYPSHLAPTFFFYCISPFIIPACFAAQSSNIPALLFVPFPVLPIHDSLSILDYTRPPVYVAVLSYLHFFFGHVSSLHLSCLSRYVTLTNWCSFVKAFYFPCHFHLDREAKCEHMWQTPSLLRMSVCVCGGGVLLTTVPE